MVPVSQTLDQGGCQANSPIALLSSENADAECSDTDSKPDHADVDVRIGIKSHCAWQTTRCIRLAFVCI